MNRFTEETVICTDFLIDGDEAQHELHQRGWSMGHIAIDGQHQVSGHKRDAWIVANAPTELDAWILACVKANEQERLWLFRN